MPLTPPQTRTRWTGAAAGAAGERIAQHLRGERVLASQVVQVREQQAQVRAGPACDARLEISPRLADELRSQAKTRAGREQLGIVGPLAQPVLRTLERHQRVGQHELSIEPQRRRVACLLDQLAQLATTELTIPWQTAPDPAAAWEMACTRVDVDGLICVSGSVFLAAEMQAIVKGAK